MDCDDIMTSRMERNMTEVSLTSLDGTRLAASVYRPDGQPKSSALLVHGIMSEKTEGGLYDLLARRLAERDCITITLDLRGHGESEGDQTDFTLSGVLNDVVAASSYLDRLGSTIPRTLVGASFGGGLSIYSAYHLIRVDQLVLLNPRVNYRPWILESTLFYGDEINKDVQSELKGNGYCERRGFRIGRQLANELATWNCTAELELLTVPFLVIHGNDDTTIPIDETRRFFSDKPNTILIEVPDAEHGFTDAETDDVQSPETKRLRSQVVDDVTSWISREAK